MISEKCISLFIWNIPIEMGTGVSIREDHVMTTGLNSSVDCAG